jgi:ABC-type sugar transport system ATPase subunit
MATVKPEPSNRGTVGTACGSPAALAVPAPRDRGRPGRGEGGRRSMTSAITATGLRKSFGGTAVLDGIDLEAGAGTTFSLLGPNGAGKTTTVQIMSTLVHADGGEVRVAGHDVARDPAAVRAAIGVTGQFSAVDNLLTSEENLVRSSPGCFSDIAEGTVYALLIRVEQRGLVDVQKVPSEKGPPRKVYSLNAQGQQYLEEFWRTWSFLTERLEQLREGGR